MNCCRYLTFNTGDRFGTWALICVNNTMHFSLATPILGYADVIIGILNSKCIQCLQWIQSQVLSPFWVRTV